MIRTYVAAKIHGIRVTHKALKYSGSVTVDAGLLARAGIQPFEQVHVVNLTTGARWVTYAIPGEKGQFVLAGGGARLGELGDECIVMTYVQAQVMPVATVLHCGENNQVTHELEYPGNPGRAE